MRRQDLGALLKSARLKRNLSQAEVAARLKLNSPQSISDWERNYGSGVPVKTLKKLIKLYQLDATEVFDALLDYQQMKLEERLVSEFYGKKNRRA